MLKMKKKHIYNNTLVDWSHIISMIEVIFDPDDIACSSIQLDYSTDEDGKPFVSHDDGGEGVSLEEEKSRMALLLGSLNKALFITQQSKTAYA